MMTLTANAEARGAGEEWNSEITGISARVIQALALNLNVMCALLLVELGDCRRRSGHVDITEGGRFLVPGLLSAVALHKGWDLSFPEDEVLWQKCPVYFCALVVWQLKDIVLDDKLPLSTLGRIQRLCFESIRDSTKVKGYIITFLCAGRNGINGTKTVAVFYIVCMFEPL